jgi:hypothetical protein
MAYGGIDQLFVLGWHARIVGRLWRHARKIFGERLPKSIPIGSSGSNV